VDNAALLERAATAKRASKRVALARSLALEDVVAMANSGGGVIVLDNGAAPERARISDALLGFDAIEVTTVTRDGTTMPALLVGEAGDLPLEVERTVYFRHGAKSAPATADDIRRFIDRRLKATRRRWLKNIRQVVVDDAVVAPVVRLSDDPTAPVYGKLDPDRTHPYRQKEVVQAVNERAHLAITPYDVLSVRRVHGIDEESHPEYAHRMKFGSVQYSEAFVEWLVAKGRVPGFFEDAKHAYSALRKPRR
jgi:hypothetical protein